MNRNYGILKTGHNRSQETKTRLKYYFNASKVSAIFGSPIWNWLSHYRNCSMHIICIEVHSSLCFHLCLKIINIYLGTSLFQSKHWKVLIPWFRVAYAQCNFINISILHFPTKALLWSPHYFLLEDAHLRDEISLLHFIVFIILYSPSNASSNSHFTRRDIRRHICSRWNDLWQITRSIQA